MKIAVIGSGALGAFYGALLQRGGAEVHFLFRRDYHRVKQQGLHVNSPLGDFHLADVNAYARPDEIPAVDLILIGVKTTANAHYQELLDPVVSPGHCGILTAQNGLGNEELLAELYGADRIYGGLAFLCSNRLEDGTIHHLDYGHLHVGKFLSQPDDVLKEFARLMEAGGMACQVVEDLALSRWKKLEWNVPFNGLSARHDLTCDGIMADPTLRHRAYALMLEIQAAAAAHGHHIEDTFLGKMMTDTDNMAPYYTSMHLDRRQGRPMEVESIFGEPLRRGQSKGVPMPELTALYEALMQIDQQEEQHLEGHQGSQKAGS